MFGLIHSGERSAGWCHPVALLCWLAWELTSVFLAKTRSVLPNKAERTSRMPTIVKPHNRWGIVKSSPGGERPKRSAISCHYIPHALVHSPVKISRSETCVFLPTNCHTLAKVLIASDSRYKVAITCWHLTCEARSSLLKPNPACLPACCHAPLSALLYLQTSPLSSR